MIRAACLYYLVILLLVNHATIFVEGCRKSCGKLRGIPYPFMFRGDPLQCGEAEYELVCEGDGEDAAAALYYGGHKYFVTYITDGSEYYMTIHVDCPITITTSTCRHQHNSSANYLDDNSSTDNIIGWANFMNCSQHIENELLNNYTVVPSLSNGNTTVYVILGYKANEFKYLHESCRFVDTFPFPADWVRKVNSSMQVFEILRKEFNVSWFWEGRKSCWRNVLRGAKYDVQWSFFPLNIYPIEVEISYLRCLGYSTKSIPGRTIIFLISFFSPFVPVGLVALAFLCKFCFAPLSICVFLAYNHRKNTRPINNIDFFLWRQQNLLPRRYSYGDITIITKNFREKLGKGGFGQVYKGELLGGLFIAVKVLDKVKYNGDDFINEVNTIGRIHHINVVQLLGFCSEGTKRALIYEYMPKGSLDRYIFPSSNNSICYLTSDKLHSIALGIARGINYLHNGCDMQILHFDIKPHNILLDNSFTPKISDFGLAKLYPKDQNLVSMSAARGTIGYIAPELISRSFGTISYKSDIYSFGMLVLEMAGRRKNFDTKVQNSSEIYFPLWIYDQLTHLGNQNSDEIVEIGEIERKLCKIGLWCIQMNSCKRPTMGQVIEFLEADVDVVEMPTKPFFSSNDEVTEVHSYIPASSVDLSIAEDTGLYVV